MSNPQEAPKLTKNQGENQPDDQGEPNGQGEDQVPSLMNEASTSRGIDLASDEVYGIKDLGLPAGPMADGYIFSHPNGLYFAQFDSTTIAENLQDEIVNGHNDNVAIFGSPQRFESKPSGKVYTPNGKYVARLLDYTRSAIDTSRADNDGTMRLVQERSNGWQLTSGDNNAHGANLKGHFDDAVETGNRELVKAIVEYVWYAFRDDVTITDGGESFIPHSDRAKAFKGLLTGAASTEEEETQTPQTSLSGIPGA